MSSIRVRLLVGMGLVTLSLWLTLAFMADRFERTEIRREFDAELFHAASIFGQILEQQGHDGELFRTLNSTSSHPGLVRLSGTDAAPLLLQVVRNGSVTYHSVAAPELPLISSADGYANAVWRDTHWRAYASRHGEFAVIVAQSTAHIEDLARLAAWQRIGALLVFLPIWLVIGSFIIHWSLRPVSALSRELSKRDENQLEPLPDSGLSTELRPMVDALNHVLHRLARALELERSFTGNAAHEMRTPLAGLRTQIEVAQSTLGKAQARAHQQALRAVDRLTNLLNQLLELARLDAAPEVNEFSPTNLQVVLRTTCASLPLEVQSQLKITSEAAAVWVSADEDQLQMALSNILRNAWQHGVSDHPIEVQVHQDAIHGSLSVRDYGSGADESQWPMLSERFFRAPDATGSGSGLGLSIARQVMQRAGGELIFERANPGLAVSLRLPIVVIDA